MDRIKFETKEVQRAFRPKTTKGNEAETFGLVLCEKKTRLCMQMVCAWREYNKHQNFTIN